MTWPFKLVKISGHSMQPTIMDGELALVNRWAYLTKKPQIGDIVVFYHAGKLWCKRIADRQNHLFHVTGDNPADSHPLPLISLKQIAGRVLTAKERRPWSNTLNLTLRS